LNYCGDKFAAADEVAHARETFTKSGNITKLMALYARKQMWQEAAKLAEGHEVLSIVCCCMMRVVICLVVAGPI
jgi:hypothetical protein